MRIRKTKSKNQEHYAIIYDVKVNGKRTTKIYENLGNYDNLKLRSKDDDPIEWLNKYVDSLNKKVKEDSLPTIIKLSPNKQIEKNKQIVYNGGYLFLQYIYYNLLNFHLDLCPEPDAAIRIDRPGRDVTGLLISPFKVFDSLFHRCSSWC